ncbi:MAG: glycoside hydrolase, partial [Acidobacteriia bacterium]|nr:glycoside hydrolase [Terriglobia bacterium]
MAQIYLCFVWHMHQPFYKDLITGEYHLPWTRMHALKDYFGMVEVLRDFPGVHQTFNLVPSLMVQIEEYAQGKAADPFLRIALKPAEELSAQEQHFILRYFFQAHPSRMIRRYPRYGELYDGWLAADRNSWRAMHIFSNQTMRDLQVLSQLAWFDEEFQTNDAEVRELVSKGRGYTLEDQKQMGRKQVEIIQQVLPVYRKFSASGQIEVTTTPFYHPILPLLCDSAIAAESHPQVPLPTRFRYPDDARRQLSASLTYMKDRMGIEPRGFWPSEGSVSDEVFSVASDLGLQWTATDNGVLSRTLGHIADTTHTYRPYLWQQDGRQMRVIFRDHYLSDLIGFVYSRMGAAEAADHFLDRIRENCGPIIASGRDALVPIILDGENAWEHYEESGRPFLREIYGRMQHANDLRALTVTEALDRVGAEPIGRIFPGSWINANFDVWIGAEEDNRAWEMLLRARQAYEVLEKDASISEGQKNLAFEELLIAEGSDWCWWYGPEHHSDNAAEFDHLYRSHLANVYRALGQVAPEELSRPILKTVAAAMHTGPTAPVRPVIDGEVSSYFEWMGAGQYQVDGRSGSMHGQRLLVRQLHYGCDGQNLYLRVDLDPVEEPVIVHLTFPEASWKLELSHVSARVLEGPPIEIAYRRVLEARIPLSLAAAPAVGIAAASVALTSVTVLGVPLTGFSVRCVLVGLVLAG